MTAQNPIDEPSDPTSVARDWLMRLHSGRVSAADQAALAFWRAADPAHEAAYHDAEAAWALLGALGTSAADVEAGLPRPHKPIFSRPRALAASIAIFAAGAALTWNFDTWLADARTAPGESRTIALADGSTIALNGGSAVSWTIDRNRREIHLVRGEAFFAVAHDAKLPFTVRAGTARMRDIGTKFDVSLGRDRVALTVQEGEVAARTSANGPEKHLIAGEQIVWHDSGLSPIAPADLDQALAWQRGRIVFKARPLGEVVAELARYRSGYIFVVNSDLRARRMTGVFDTANPDAVLDAVARVLPAHVVRITPFLTIIG